MKLEALMYVIEINVALAQCKWEALCEGRQSWGCTRKRVRKVKVGVWLIAARREVCERFALVDEG